MNDFMILARTIRPTMIAKLSPTSSKIPMRLMLTTVKTFLLSSNSISRWKSLLSVESVAKGSKAVRRLTVEPVSNFLTKGR